jgi:hypothetical protein
VVAWGLHLIHRERAHVLGFDTDHRLHQAGRDLGAEDRPRCRNHEHHSSCGIGMVACTKSLMGCGDKCIILPDHWSVSPW